MGPCMCGDTHCSSCGPAQGNFRCDICGAWADDGCIHINEKTGKYKWKYRPELRRIAKAEAAAEDKLVLDIIGEKEAIFADLDEHPEHARDYSHYIVGKWRESREKDNAQ